MQNPQTEKSRDTSMSDELEVLRRWLDEGRRVALATVTDTWRSSPRPVGSHLVVDQDSHFAGSVSGGCIEGAVITEALEVLKDQQPRSLEFGVSDETAWEVGLSCGGAIQIFVEPVY
ncbi:MAG: XdhC family protein [Pseudomonadales bacterium]